MKSTWMVLGSIAAALVLGASAASAVQGAATANARVEVSADEGGVKPEVHIWINGKEVNPEDVGNLGGEGGLRIEGRKDLRDLRPERGERQPPTPYLGVMVGPVEENAAGEGGARVNSIIPGGPAAEAGLAEGDLITHVGDKRVIGPQQFVELIHEYKPGDRITIKWTRDGKEMEKRIVLAARPGQGPASSRREEGQKETQPAEAFLGVMAAPLTEDMKQIAGTERGVLINSLRDGSPAAEAGLLPGDVITAVDGKDVTTPAELIDVVRTRKPGDTARIDYYRSGKKRTANAKLATRPAEERRYEGGGALGMPEGLLEQVPELKGYMGQLRRWLEENRSRREGGQFPEPMPNMPMPSRPPEMPQAPRRPDILPAPPGAPAPRQESYDVGKDIGKILERLDRIDKRLGDIERRLDRIEKKPER
ncbi:MAG: PDZ domain-containing protein [Planctomycetota bacterium]|nr:PDZ domain-containing protein [Planctomycetota bacterium]